MQAEDVPHNGSTNSWGSQYTAARIGRALTSVMLILFVFSVVTRSLVLSALALGGATVLILRNLNTLVAAAPRQRSLLLFAGGLLTLTLPFALLRNETAFVHYFVSILSILTAYLLTRSPDSYFFGSRAVLILSLASVVTYLMTTGVQGFPLENMIPDSSSNGITSYLVILQANFCIVSYLVRRKLPLITPLVTLGICIVGYGRGSILAVIMIILIGFIAYSFKNGPRHFMIACALCAGLAVSFGNEIVLFVETNTKIGSGLYDASRETMIKQYGALLERDEHKIVTGADYRGTSIETEYRGNPHNSFIRAHHLFGLPFLMLVLAFPLLASWGQDLATRAYPLALLAVMLFRAATEPILFPTLLDVFFFSVCFLMGNPKVRLTPSGVTHA